MTISSPNFKSIREFATGATRDQDVTKVAYEGFLSPIAIEAFGQYMQAHRKQSDGTLRAPDNWQKGIPLQAYMESMWRHFFAVWAKHRNSEGPFSVPYDQMIEDLCGLFFNVQGYIHEYVKAGKRVPLWAMTPGNFKQAPEVPGFTEFLGAPTPNNDNSLEFAADRGLVDAPKKRYWGGPKIGDPFEDCDCFTCESRRGRRRS